MSFGGGPLLSLNESRRQQAEHGAYVLGEAFEAMCAADLRTTTEIFCDLAEHEADQLDDGKWPLSAHGASGYLRNGRDMSMTARGAGEKAAAAVGAALSASGAGDDPAPAVAVLVDRLHNAAAWAALMAAPGDAAALGRALLDALDSGALLGHPETHPAAAGLLAALADEAGDDPAAAARLEAAVLRTRSLIDANGGHPRRKDALLGCLRPGTITSPELAGRLGELGPEGPPAVEPRMRVEATFTPWSIVDGLADEGVALAAAGRRGGPGLRSSDRLNAANGRPGTIGRRTAPAAGGVRGRPDTRRSAVPGTRSETGAVTGRGGGNAGSRPAAPPRDDGRRARRGRAPGRRWQHDAGRLSQ